MRVRVHSHRRPAVGGAGRRGRRQAAASAGLAGFAALEAAVFVRYTDLVVLGCAVAAVVAAVVAAAKLRAVPGAALGWWLGPVAVSAAGLALFDDLGYGGPLTSGYRPGEITFSPGAVLPNLRYMAQSGGCAAAIASRSWTENHAMSGATCLPRVHPR
jgi:hypothetical protein